MGDHVKYQDLLGLYRMCPDLGLRLYGDMKDELLYRIQPSEQFILRGYGAGDDLYEIFTKGGFAHIIQTSAMRSLINQGYVERIAVGYTMAQHFAYCARCGAHEDHTGWQFYPMDGVCRIL